MTTDLRRTTWFNGKVTWSGSRCTVCSVEFYECRASIGPCCHSCADLSTHDERQEIPVPEPKTTEELAEQALQPAEDKDPRQPDPELEAIRAVLAAVEGLDPHASARVLTYCSARINAASWTSAYPPHFPLPSNLVG